jgi:hypothetical protein
MENTGGRSLLGASNTGGRLGVIWLFGLRVFFCRPRVFCQFLCRFEGMGMVSHLGTAPPQHSHHGRSLNPQDDAEYHDAKRLVSERLDSLNLGDFEGSSKSTQD